ncbi:class I SAM-dependent methyltransferase [Dinoroseobacter sp. S124A]|uniref:class I SAM-dependent methyltransferase n=1 Tax=Dinoroseobacter sp. S124A TaxID=3415128 RepID=UPI003C7E0C83
MSRSEDLISEYRKVHAGKVYGQTSELLTGYILRQVAFLPPPRRIFDYGCGQARTVDWLAKIFDAEAYRYDPGLPDHAERPEVTADLVICTDVMEHIPLEDVDRVLAEIRSISPHAFFNISCVKAAEILPNGENAHCTVRPARWWATRLGAHFDIVRKTRSFTPNSVCLVTWPRPETAEA